MKRYNFKTINPYARGNDSKFQNLEVKLPDDMKLCMNYMYPKSEQQFWIFFYPYNEWLFEYINSLTHNNGFGLNHAHAYKIGDYMVGNLSNVHLQNPDSYLPTETLDELNERFLNVFGNHLMKIEEKNLGMRLVEREMNEFMIFNVNEDDSDMSKWPEEKKQRYAEVMERYKKESENPYHTLCIRRFLGFVKDESLVIKTATVWGDDPTRIQHETSNMITVEEDKLFMLLDTYNPSVARRLVIEDSQELWDELKQRQKEINALLERK